MSDYISRQAAIELVHKVMFEFLNLCGDSDESPITEKDKAILAINKKISNRFKSLPSAQKTGTWIVTNGACEPDYMECSQCRWITEYYGGLEEEWNYCPRCGAKMVVEE